MRFVFFSVFTRLQKTLRIWFIDKETSLCLVHSAFMGANNVLGGSFALLIDGQMVYKQVPLLFPVFLSFDTRQYYGVLATNSMFVNLTFGHNTSECQWKDSWTLIRATVWRIAQEHPTSMIEVFAHHGMKTKTMKTFFQDMFQGTGKLLVKAYVQMPMDVRGPPGQFQDLFNWFLVPCLHLSPSYKLTFRRFVGGGNSEGIKALCDQDPSCKAFAFSPEENAVEMRFAIRDQKSFC